ncbi:MAG: hypothetical protein TE42_07400 [Candidatus Synechococcus spongiarum SP3]|uniref:Uncharacterized protein n=1 Tax=Candidatus Synechococcus spongiarum SP3 TaxID=1604020 RepID=A0A0G2HJZ5_9SYNE|nr:MAG: hypothetical protein TE42_07400 [Candidatus Synechococcus spongiarum SP3]
MFRNQEQGQPTGRCPGQAVLVLMKQIDRVLKAQDGMLAKGGRVNDAATTRPFSPLDEKRPTTQ